MFLCSYSPLRQQPVADDQQGIRQDIAVGVSNDLTRRHGQFRYGNDRCDGALFNRQNELIAQQR